MDDAGDKVEDCMSRPKIIDDDHSAISVMLDGEELQSWHYGDRAERREKMRHAHYFCDGFMAGQGARKIEPEEIAQEPSADELRAMRQLYEAEKAAGLLDSREEYEAKLRDAGRGHLIGG